jgi:excisionase family DNA binding protein
MNRSFIVKKDLARQWSCSVRTIDNWMRAKLIPYYKIRGAVRFDSEQVSQALEKCEKKSRYSK